MNTEVYPNVNEERFLKWKVIAVILCVFIVGGIISYFQGIPFIVSTNITRGPSYSEICAQCNSTQVDSFCKWTYDGKLVTFTNINSTYLPNNFSILWCYNMTQIQCKGVVDRYANYNISYC